MSQARLGPTSPGDSLSESAPLHNINHFLATTDDILYRLRLTPEPVLEYVNPAVEAFTGYTPAELVQNPKLFASLFLPEDFRSLKQLSLEDCQAEKNVRLLHRDGSIIWSEHHVLPVLQNGKLVGIEGLARVPIRLQQKVFGLQNNTRQMIRHVVELGTRLNQSGDIHHLAQAIGEGFREISAADLTLVLQPWNTAVDMASGEDLALKVLWSQGMEALEVNAIKAALKELLPAFPAAHAIHFYSLKTIPLSEDHPLRISLEKLGVKTLLLCPLLSSGQLRGVVVCAYREEISRIGQERYILDTFAQQSAVAIENNRLQSELEDAYLQSVMALARAMDARDSYTSLHGQNLVELVEATARHMGLDEKVCESLCWAAILHDIGKIGIPDRILSKPACLDEDEWLCMRQHPDIGIGIIASLKCLQSAVPIIRSHHEHFDGSGYPAGLEGEQIPLAARILAVADAYSAMTDNRVYRPARSSYEAVLELKRCAGTQFDPRVVAAFLTTINDLPPRQPLTASPNRLWTMFG